MREHGKITNTEYQHVEGISERTATRDLTALVQQGILVSPGTKGRGVAYSLKLPESRQSRQKAAKYAIIGFGENLMTKTAQADLSPAKQPSPHGLWLLPAGWEWVPLDQQRVEMQSGFACARKHSDPNGLPHLRPFNIGIDGEIDLTQLIRVPFALRQDLSAFSLRAGDVLFNNTNSVELVGKTAIVREPLECAFSNHITRLRVHITSQIDSSWLALALRLLQSKGYFSQHCNKWIGQAGFNPTKLAEVLIPLPNLDTQRRIVARIEALLAELKEMRALAAAIRRDTDRVMDAALAEVFSELPSSRRSLIEVLEGKPRNGWSPQCDDNPAGTPVLKLGAVLGFRFNSSAIKYTHLPVDPQAHYWLTKDDVLISRSNTPDLVGHAAVYSGEPSPCIYPDLLMRMRIRPTEADPQFVVYWLRGKEARMYVRAYATGASSTMKKITQGDVCSIPFPRISLDEQKHIVAYLGAVQTEVAEMRCLQAQDAELLDMLEQSILERAFRGQL